MLWQSVQARFYGGDQLSQERNPRREEQTRTTDNGLKVCDNEWWNYNLLDDRTKVDSSAILHRQSAADSKWPRGMPVEGG